MLIRRAELDGRVVADVRVGAGTVVEIGPELAASAHEDVLDARGGALLPGLCDHHLHLYALAAAGRSVACGPPSVTGPQGLAETLARAGADAGGWVRGVGYSDDVAGPLDATALDRLHATRPVRIQHRSGALWMVNTAGARALGLADAAHPGVERDGHARPTGRLWRADDWLQTRLPGARPPDLHAVGAHLARLGITHLTDATADLDDTAIGAIDAAMRTGALPQRVQMLGAPLGWRAPGGPRAPTAGPYKIVLPDSALPGLDELVERIQAAHRAGRAVAVHCVTRESLILLVTALDRVGPRAGDRIEHAALVPAELIPRLRALGLAVVTQPGFLADRGDDYLRDVPTGDHADLYRARSLIDGGVPLAFSSDAPYGPVDPWTAIGTAVRRLTASGRIVGADERLGARRALDAYLGPPGAPGGAPRRVTPGAPADLVLLRAPLADALARPAADLVAATLVAGSVVTTPG
jgi:predicted amidohydrolase YtcJ